MRREQGRRMGKVLQNSTLSENGFLINKVISKNKKGHNLCKKSLNLLKK